MAPGVSTDRIEHDVDAVRRQLTNCRRPAGIAAVERLHAIGPERVVLAGRRETDDPEAEYSAQLGDSQPDAAGGGMHEHAFTASRRGNPREQMVRRQVDDGERRALLKAPLLWERKHVLDRHDHQLALPAELRRRNHPTAHGRPGHAAAECVHNAGDFITDHGRGSGRSRVEALPREQIGEVDSGRTHANAYRARRDRGVWRFAHGENFWGAIARDDQLCHPSKVALIDAAELR